MDFFEHGKVPAGLSNEVENAITKIKTEPRKLLNRFKKSKTDDQSNKRINGDENTDKKPGKKKR